MSPQPGYPTIARTRLACLFLLVTVGFAFYRWSPFVVWDDSCSSAMERVTEDDLTVDQRLKARMDNLHVNPLTVAGTLIWEAFTKPTGGYRPLAKIYCWVSIGYLYDSHHPGLPHLLLVGLLFGTFAVLYLQVACRFVEREASAWFALILMLGSPPMAATCWIYMSFPQVIVPLLMCASLLSYWGWVERGRIGSLITLIALVLLSPWIREILFVVPLLLLYLESQRSQRSYGMIALAALAFGHAVFPTALLKVTCCPDLPLQSMFAFGGSVSKEMSGDLVRWFAACSFFPLLPPTLWLCAMLSGIVRQPDSQGPRTVVRLVAVWLPGVLSVSAGVLCWFGFVQSGLVCCLIIPALAWQWGLSFLSLWFLLLFLPLMRVYTEHIHFLYAMAPAAIVMAGGFERLWLRLAGSDSNRSAVSLCVVSIRRTPGFGPIAESVWGLSVQSCDI